MAAGRGRAVKEEDDMSGYVGYLFEVEKHSRYGDDGLRVEGRICYTLAPSPAKSPTDLQQEALARWDKASYRIGVLLERGQRLDHIAYAREGGGEIVLRPDAAVTEELIRLFRPRPDEEWVGLRPESDARRRYEFIAPNVVCFFLRLDIAPAKRDPQLLPVVARHQGNFVSSFMPGLWALPALK